MAQPGDMEKTFAQCTANLSGTEMQELMAQMLSIFNLYRSSLLVFIFVGLLSALCNTLFLILLVFGFRRRYLPQKRYCFIVSRTMSDLLTSLFTLLWAVLDKTGMSAKNLLNNIHVVEVSLSCWVVAGSYVALAVVTFMAAKHPLYYKTEMTLKKCMFALAVVWLWAIFYTSVITPLGGSAFFSHPSSKCSRKCQLLIVVLTASTLLLSYLVVPAVYLTVLALLRTGKNCSKCGHVSKRNLKNYWKLGVFILTYTIFGSPIVMLTVVAFLLIQIAAQPTCYSYQNMDQSQFIFLLRISAHFILNLRSLVDPIVSISADTKLRDALACRAMPMHTTFTTSARVPKIQFSMSGGSPVTSVRHLRRASEIPGLSGGLRAYRVRRESMAHFSNSSSNLLAVPGGHPWVSGRRRSRQNSIF